MPRAFLAWSLSERGLRVLSEPRIARIVLIAQMPRPFVPGFWIPACAGMTVEVGGLGGWAVMSRAVLSRSLSESGIAGVV